MLPILFVGGFYEKKNLYNSGATVNTCFMWE